MAKVDQQYYQRVTIRLNGRQEKKNKWLRKNFARVSYQQS
jgi:hypothetical protein